MYQVDLTRIATIESSNRPDAVSFRGAVYGRGLHQISEVALKDYNTRFKQDYQPEDLFDPEINTKIAQQYFGMIDRYLRYYGIPVNMKHRLAAYNWGIGNVRKWYRAGGEVGKLPAETQNYITKYYDLGKDIS